MTETERKTAEQTVAEALNELWNCETHDGSEWSAGSHEVVTIVDSLREAGLLVGEPTEEQIEASAIAIQGVHRPEGMDIPAWDSEDEKWRKTYRDFARAALTAAAVTPPAPSELVVDEAKLAKVINRALDAWQGKERSEVFVARAVSEWLRGESNGN